MKSPAKKSKATVLFSGEVKTAAAAATESILFISPEHKNRRFRLLSFALHIELAIHFWRNRKTSNWHGFDSSTHRTREQLNGKSRSGLPMMRDTVPE